MQTIITMKYRGQMITVDAKQAKVLEARMNRPQPKTVEDVTKTHVKEAVSDTFIVAKSAARTAVLGAAYAGVLTTEQISKYAMKANTGANNLATRIAESILGRSK